MGCGGSKQQVDSRASTPRPSQQRSRPASVRSHHSNKSVRSNRQSRPASRTEPVKTEEEEPTVEEITDNTSLVPTPVKPLDEADDNLELEEALRPKTAEEISAERRDSITKLVDEFEEILLPEEENKSRNDDWIGPPPSQLIEEDEILKAEESFLGGDDSTLPPKQDAAEENGMSKQDNEVIEDLIVPVQEIRLGEDEETLPPTETVNGNDSPDFWENGTTEPVEKVGESETLPIEDTGGHGDLEDPAIEKRMSESAGERQDPESGEAVAMEPTEEAEDWSKQETSEEVTLTTNDVLEEDGRAESKEDVTDASEKVVDLESTGAGESAEEAYQPESVEEVAIETSEKMNDQDVDDEAKGNTEEEKMLESAGDASVITEEEGNKLESSDAVGIETNGNGLEDNIQESEVVADIDVAATTVDGGGGTEIPLGEHAVIDNDAEEREVPQRTPDGGRESGGKPGTPVNGNWTTENEAGANEVPQSIPDDDGETGGKPESPVDGNFKTENEAEGKETPIADVGENESEPVEGIIEQSEEPSNDIDEAAENPSPINNEDDDVPENDEENNAEVVDDSEPAQENEAGSAPDQDTAVGEVVALSVVNTYTDDIALPEEATKPVADGVPAVRGFARSTWPVRCYLDLTEFSVNASYGGCASLVLVSCSYNVAENSTTEIFLLRSGFDMNHFQPTSLIKFHAGHFGAENGLETDEEGRLIVHCLFGHNYASMLCNDPIYGNGLYGLTFQTGDEEIYDLPFNVNEGGGGGTSLIFCSAELPGAGDTEVVSAVYVLRSGVDSDIFQVKKFSEQGTDSWKFEVASGGTLQISGPSRSKVALFHNRTDAGVQNDSDTRTAKVVHRQAYRGDDETELLRHLPNHALVLVLCSSSSGTEDKTTAALYMVTVSASDTDSVNAKAEFIEGSTKSADSPDLWTFSTKAGTLIVTGPEHSCRYGVICNIPVDGDEETSEFGCCLATGNAQPMKGSVAIDKEAVTGWVSERSRILVTHDETPLAMFEEGQLVETGDNKFAFQRQWKEEEKAAGLSLVRVFAVQSDQEKSDKFIELSGSPCHLVRQPEGVLFAINCAGPSYQAINNIVYESDHKYYKNYGLESQSKAFGGVKPTASIYQLLTNTQDGFMHRSARSTGVEATQEQKIEYKIPNIPDGNYKVRMHFASLQRPTCYIQGQDMSHQVSSQLDATKEITPGYTACQVILPIPVTDGALHLSMRNVMLCGFAVTTDNYEEPDVDEQHLKWEKQEKQKLADSADLLPRTLTRKKIKIAGWSPNFLQNASGETGDMSCWNHGGEWTIQEGGYGTEKAFVSSHMWCSKYQAVDLTEHFSEEYLDTAPDIQVFEWYHEGVCGGGFYKFEATLMDADGNALKSYSSGEIGRIYTGKWDKQEVTFTDYGPGVRSVGINSAGKDDKGWGGHYGSKCAAASIRVKRETETADGDAFEDFDLTGRDSTSNDKVVLRVLSENASIVEKTAEEGPGEETLTVFRGAEVLKVFPARKREKKKKREIRVFVSSTFRDFQREREYLIKKTFSQLNRLCADLHVFFTYVDLRWGITTEQTHFGRTIDICLKEVDRCRPYFVCLMGDRYGWSQKEGEEDELLDGSFDYAIENNPKFEWIKDYRYDTSITKLEVLYGALLNTEAAKDRSFFYLREPPDTLDYFVDPDDIKVFTSESDWHHERQYELRESVMNSNLNHRSYKTPEEVCDLIKKDLEKCVIEDFPVGTDLTVLEREREAHLAFAEARRRVYIGRQEYFDQINEIMTEGQDKPLVILGESGSGKSALVANWIGKFEENHPDAFVFVHFIGSSAESASHIKLLRRLLEELKMFFGFEMAIPRSDTNVLREFPTWLRLAGSRGKVVIVLDALNQLDSGTGGEEQDLLWLPRPLPRNVCMLLSTLPGRSFDAVKLAEWPTFTVEALQPSEKETIITQYLEGIYGKTLTEDQKQMIIDAPQSNNPLYLRALLDELRVFGRFEILSKRIEQLLSAEDPSVLFGKILERLEQDFESGSHGREGLVRDTTTAVWCAHRGMSEEELINMLDVPSAVWSPFYLSLEDNLINRNGILNFFHDHLRQAVEARYLPTQEDKQQHYRALANFFANRPIDDRVVDELPFLWAQANELERLRSTITDLEVFRRLMKNEEGKFQLVKSWKILGDYSQVEPAYLESLGKHDNDTNLSGEKLTITLQYMAEFFMELGLLNSARSLFEKLLLELETNSLESHGTVVYHPQQFSRRHRSKHPHVIDVMHKLGKVCEKQMDLDEAKRYFSDALDRQNRIVTPAQKLKLVEGLLGMGSVLGLQDQPGEAKKVFLRAKEVATDVLGPNHHYVAAIIGQVGKLCYSQGRLDEALGFYLQDLKLTRSHVGTNHPRTAGIINSIALVYDDKNDELAGTLYEVALAILLETYGPAHIDVAHVRHNLGAFYFATNRSSRAKYQLEEAIKIYEAFIDPDQPDPMLQETQQALDDVIAFSK
ncbi:uncharacterized protein [Ptychodera flava]|uniref:uncharacterized protein n=1 Tax=Ptychodera flava TaxID=63121 RepID=UPI003969C271